MGIVYALTCAFFWALAVIFLKRAGERVHPFALNLFRVVASLPLLTASVLVAGLPLFPPTPVRDVLILLSVSMESEGLSPGF